MVHTIDIQRIRRSSSRKRHPSLGVVPSLRARDRPPTQPIQIAVEVAPLFNVAPGVRGARRVVLRQGLVRLRERRQPRVLFIGRIHRVVFLEVLLRGLEALQGLDDFQAQRIFV